MRDIPSSVLESTGLRIENPETPSARERPLSSSIAGRLQGGARRLFYAMTATGALLLTGTSCNSPTQMKLSGEVSLDATKHYKSFDTVPPGASLIGESFTLNVVDAEGNTSLIYVTLYRPSPERVELSVDNKTYVISNGDMKNLLDIQRHKKGIALNGKGELIPGVTVTGEAVVETPELTKNLVKLRDTKDGPPSLEVEAEVPFKGKQKIYFSAEEVRK